LPKPVVGDSLATLQLRGLLPPVDRRRPHAQRELDALLTVIPGGFDQLRLKGFRVTKIALRQRRAVVGQLGLGADQADLTVKTLVAQGRRRRRSSQRGSNDHDTHDLASPQPKSTLASRRGRPGLALIDPSASGNGSCYSEDQ